MVSFIIPAYNEESLLGETLRAVDVAATAPGEPWEVMVGGAGSGGRGGSPFCGDAFARPRGSCGRSRREKSWGCWRGWRLQGRRRPGGWGGWSCSTGSGGRTRRGRVLDSHAVI